MRAGYREATFTFADGALSYQPVQLKATHIIVVNCGAAWWK